MNIIGKLTLGLAFFCFVSAPALKWALNGWMPFMGLLLAFAAIFFVFSVLSNLRFYRNLLRSESIHFVATSFVFGVILFLFLTALNYTFYKRNVVFDLTENKVNSLSDFTMSVVDGLDKDLYFYFLSTDSESSKNEEAFIQKILEKFQRRNSKIHFKSLSNYKDPEVAEDFNLGQDESAFFAVFGNKKHRLKAVSEAHLTNAILRLTKKAKKVYVLQGHGERALEDEGAYGLMKLKVELERLYYEIAPLESFDIPGDAAFVAIIGPRISYPKEGMDKLRRYVEKGGSLLIAIDPGEAHNLALLTKSFGVEFQNTFIYATSQTVGMQDSKLTVFVESIKNRHELLTSQNPKSRPLFFISSPLRLEVNDLTTKKVTPLFKYGEKTLIKAEMSEKAPVVGDGGQIAGVVVESDQNEDIYSRVMVFGDSDFLSNQFFGQHANFSLIMNVFSFLTKDKDMVKLKPRLAKTTYLLMTQTQLNFYILLFIFPLPLVYFLLALFFKLRRAFL